MTTTTPIQFGFLLIPLQALDMIGPMDILDYYNKSMLTRLGVPESITSQATDIEFHHIGPTLEPVLTTGRAKISPTTTIADCPKLDYLLVGGPGFDYIQNVPLEIKDFIRERSKEVKSLFTTCTGGMVVAATGILDGLEATTNHMTISQAKEWFPDVKWNNEKYWVVDGKFWTGAGAVAGMDMIAHWGEKEFGPVVGQQPYYFLDYKPRDVDGKPIADRGPEIKL